MGFESDIVQDTPDTGTADRIGVEGVKPCRHDLRERPSRDGAILGLGSVARYRDDSNASGGDHRTRSPRARRVLQPLKAQMMVTLAPRAHRAIGAAQSMADVHMAWGVGIGGPQNNPGA